MEVKTTQKQQVTGKFKYHIQYWWIFNIKEFQIRIGANNNTQTMSSMPALHSQAMTLDPCTGLSVSFPPLLLTLLFFKHEQEVAGKKFSQ